MMNLGIVSIEETPIVLTGMCSQYQTRQRSQSLTVMLFGVTKPSAQLLMRQSHPKRQKIIDACWVLYVQPKYAHIFDPAEADIVQLHP